MGGEGGEDCVLCNGISVMREQVKKGRVMNSCSTAYTVNAFAYN